MSRARLEESSYLRKLLAYNEILARTLYRSHFGVSTFFILTVTHSEARMRTIMELSNKVTEDKWSPFFLFKTLNSLGDGMKVPQPMLGLLVDPWERQGHPPFCFAKA